MRKAFRHTGVLMMIAVVALGLVGAAYALWFEDLQLTANVSTGTLNADVSIHPWTGSAFGTGTSADGTYGTGGRPVVDQVTGTNPPSVHSLVSDPAHYPDFGDFPAGKPPTTCGAAIGTYGTNGTNANDTVDHNSLTLNMGGLYPYAGCEFLIDVHSTGSVPIHLGITGLSLNSCTGFDANGGCLGASPLASAPWSLGLAPGSSAQCQAFFAIFNPATPPTIPSQINLGPTTPLQLHQGDEVACQFKLILDQANVEGQFFQFQATYKAYQWNENPF